MRLLTWAFGKVSEEDGPDSFAGDVKGLLLSVGDAGSLQLVKERATHEKTRMKSNCFDLVVIVFQVFCK